MDLKVLTLRSALKKHSSKMELKKDASSPVLRHVMMRNLSQESAFCIELTKSGGDWQHQRGRLDSGQAGSGSHKSVAFQTEPRQYQQHWNMGQEADDEASDMSQEMNGTGSSDLQASGSGRVGSTTSDASVRIEIRDSCHEGSSNFTTSTLHKCKKQVLRPYWNLLIFIGWRGFNRESIFAQGIRWRFLNALYTSLVMLLLVYSYSYEVLACEWKLNIKRDTMPVPHEVSSRPAIPWTPCRLNRTVSNCSRTANLDPDKKDSVYSNIIDRILSDEARGMEGNPACDHIVTSYLIPGMLHLIAYVIGFYYFRVQENEQLDALMEKVFLQATTLQARTASQHNMVRTQRYYLTFGGIWVFLSALLQCLYMWAFNFPQMPLFTNVPRGSELILFALEVLGRTVFNAVIVAIMMNFVTQCEMIKFYVKGLVMRLQEKSTDLKTAMKDVLTLRQTLSQLNGLISKMTTLAGVILAELTVIGIFLLLVNENQSPKVWVYRALFPLVWAVMFGFPLYHAARVNSICLRIHKVALEMRVFGYKGASLLDLDSFMQFVHHTKLVAKIFHINVIPSQLIFVCLVGAFILLVLIQTSNIGPANLII